jgi:hypothetical protein
LGKEPQYPLDRGLGGLQSWSGHSGEEEKCLPYLCLEWNPSDLAYEYTMNHKVHAVTQLLYMRIFQTVIYLSTNSTRDKLHFTFE